LKLNRIANALLAAQESQSVPDADESQDTSAQNEPELKHEAVYVSETVYTDEGAGSIVIKAKTVPGWSPLVEINLDWIETSDHPGWSLSYVHHPDYLLEFLPDYLRQFCPVGKKMIEALEELGLENFTQDYPGDDEEEVPPYGNN
jgi:hypothetical protein